MSAAIDSVTSTPRPPDGAQVACDESAERAVLSAVVFARGAIDDVRSILEPKDFFVGAHRHIYAAALAISDSGDPVDQQLIGSHLTRKRKFEEVGGWAFLADLQSATPAPENVGAHAKVVASLARHRRVVDAARLIVADGSSSASDSDAFTDRAEKLIQQAAERADAVPVSAIWQVVQRRAKQLEQNRSAGTGMGIPTPWESVNAVTRGMRFGSVSVVAALTGGGKSIYALQVARHVAAMDLNGEKLAALYVSGEMSEEELVDRATCSEAEVNEYTYAAEFDRDDVMVARDKLSRLRLYLHAKIASIADVRYALRDAQRDLRANRADRSVAPPRIGLIVIDYLQLMRVSKSADRYDLALGEFVMELKDIANEHRLHVLALAQINKESKKREGGRPTTEDLKHSTGISDAAHSVMFIHRPWLIDPNSSRKEFAEFVITKGRSHATGGIKMRFDGERYRFVEPAPGEFDDQRRDTVSKQRRGRYERNGGPTSHSAPPPYGDNY